MTDSRAVAATDPLLSRIKDAESRRPRTRPQTSTRTNEATCQYCKKARLGFGPRQLARCPRTLRAGTDPPKHGTALPPH